MFGTEAVNMYLWDTDELGDGHRGRAGAVAEDGTEPRPISIPAMNGGGSIGTITEWWGFNGRMGGPIATHLRGSCSCGWRGATLHPLDWDEAHKERHPSTYDTSGPAADWKAHVRDVESRLVALPDDVAELLEKLGSRLSELADKEPLAALRAADIAQRDALLYAGCAAMKVGRDDTSLAAAGVALGYSTTEAQSRLRAYYPHF